MKEISVLKIAKLSLDGQLQAKAQVTAGTPDMVGTLDIVVMVGIWAEEMIKAK